MSRDFRSLFCERGLRHHDATLDKPPGEESAFAAKRGERRRYFPCDQEKGRDMAQRAKTQEENSPEYDEIRKTLGTRFREARQKAGLTQSQLGAKADVPQSYVFEMETGGANITLRTLARMATALDMDARDFLPESRAAPLSAASLDRLYSLLEGVVVTIRERHTQESRLLVEVQAFLDAQPRVDRGPPPEHDPVSSSRAPKASGKSGAPKKTAR